MRRPCGVRHAVKRSSVTGPRCPFPYKAHPLIRDPSDICKAGASGAGNCRVLRRKPPLHICRTAELLRAGYARSDWPCAGHIIEPEFPFSFPNSLTLYAPRSVPANCLSLTGPRGSGQDPVCPNASPETVDRAAFPSGFVRHHCRPWRLWIDFPAATASGDPAGRNSRAIRPSVLANNRLVRWLSSPLLIPRRGNFVRPAGRVRMGFFPLPLTEAQRIRRFLLFPNLSVSALDPCVSGTPCSWSWNRRSHGNSSS